MVSDKDQDVTVVGGGPAGLTAAVALAVAGIPTALVAPPHRADNRTTALMAGSVTALEALGVWPRLAAKAAPLEAIRIIDDRGGLLRAPEVTFRADEIGLAAFAHNVENRDLVEALAARAAELPALTVIEQAATEVVADEAYATIRLADGRALRSRLVVAADGRGSLCRQAAGIAVERWTYPQTALTCNLAHSRPHNGVSTEFHTAAGPFTLVPLGEGRSSLVWLTEPAMAEHLHALPDEEFARAAERQAHSLLGKMTLAAPRAMFPMAGHTARPLAARRIALVGESAHLIPPIGAQGFNLGLRDAATIAELAADAVRADGDPGAEAVLQRYDRQRRADVGMRTLAVDLLNRSLLADFLPVQGLRGLGLALLERVGPLRRAMMREGVSPQAGAPALMRGVAP